MFAAQCAGRDVLTIEGLTADGGLDRIQRAFVDAGAVQCGYCTPGMVLSAYALLSSNPNPTREEIEDAISGNLCRCTGYVKIVDAVEKASG
jgi:carbon-monoxide dehydrogenase small subunit